MANHRMFSKEVVSSGRFLRMPPTARLLYYDLGMAADDEGVVEAYTVMTTTRANEDDLRVLVAKGYVKILNEELVALICDWNVNNIIRADRKKDSLYKDLLLQMFDGNQLTTICQPTVNQMTAQDKISKDNTSKDNKGSAKFAHPTLLEVEDFIKEKGYKVDAEKFFYYYESNGWKVGKNPMKNWKAAVAQWNAKDKEQKAPAKPNQFNSFQKSDTDYAKVRWLN